MTPNKISLQIVATNFYAAKPRIESIYGSEAGMRRRRQGWKSERKGWGRREAVTGYVGGKDLNLNQAKRRYVGLAKI